jgi:hypothetical protein
MRHPGRGRQSGPTRKVLQMEDVLVYESGNLLRSNQRMVRGHSGPAGMIR